MPKKHYPAYAIRSGRPMLMPQRKRGMARIMVETPDFRIKRVLRKVSHRPRVIGRVNHATRPLAKWWLTGFERDAAAWARARVWRGTSGLRFPSPPSHEMRREAMSFAWFNYQENLSEREVSSYVPGVAEFHLHGMRYWLGMKRMEARRRAGRREKPWYGPSFRWTAKNKG